MSGLVLSLKAHEKFLVNGALVQNGEKRSQIHLPDSSVNVLRLSDCLHPDTITTPVRRAYYIAQLILSGDETKETVGFELISALSVLETVFANTEVVKQVEKASAAAAMDRFYSVLCCLKRVFAAEEELLSYTAQPAIAKAS